MSVEKLSAEKIATITSDANRERGWRNNERRNFSDFTAVKSIENANLQSAELNYSDFHGISFKNVDFSRAELRYANFEGCSFENCRFENDDGEFTQFKGAKFKNCLLDGTWIFANFSEAEFSECSFKNADLLYANMQNAVFTECEALNVQHLDMAKLPHSLGGLKYDKDHFPNL